MRIVAKNWESNSNKIKELENSKDLEYNYLKPGTGAVLLQAGSASLFPTL